MTLKLHRMQLPREVVVGEGTIDLIPGICKKLELRKSAFVITGKTTYRIAGKRVIDLLQDSGVEVDYEIFGSSSEISDVKIAESRIIKGKPQVILGVGGGNKIDIAKLSSAHQNIPFISVPTAATHDGIASPVASFKRQERPYSMMAQSPIVIVVDTEIIAKTPRRFTASGCGDAIAKFTAVRDWKLAHKRRNEYYGGYAASLALMGAKHVIDNAKIIGVGDEEGLRVLLEALISCGVAMGIAGSSRPCSGSEHLFCHALSLLKPNSMMHGECCGVGTIMMAYLHNEDWELIRKTLAVIGAPTTAEDLNVDPELIIEALKMADKIRPERYTILNERKITYEVAEAIAKRTGVI